MKGRLLNIKPLSLVKEMSENAFHLDALQMANSVPSGSLSNKIHAAFFSNIWNMQSGFQISAFAVHRCSNILTKQGLASSRDPLYR